jgi:biotin transport system substrate-specific component
MLQHFEATRTYSRQGDITGFLAYHLALSLTFTLLTIIAARITVEIGGPVPFTMQVLAVLLAGMVLGSVDGAMSQMFYVSLIALGAPIDARGLGALALQGPTAGFLIGFIPMAFVAGFLVEHGFKFWWLRWLAGVVGIIVLYGLGAPYLKYKLGMSWQMTWDVAVEPFLALDMAKAFIAATLTEGMRRFLAKSLAYRV